MLEPSLEDDRAMWREHLYEEACKRLTCRECLYCVSWSADGTGRGPEAGFCTADMEPVPSGQLDVSIYQRGCEPEELPPRWLQEADGWERAEIAMNDLAEEALFA